ncbi:MAG: dipeptidase [Tenuifilaceae bacterium]|nr:dipeptidase [Tenuifilaceae bacterium]
MTKLPILLMLLLMGSCVSNQSKTDEKLLEQARKIHERIVTIDTHTDTPLMFNRTGFDFSGKALERKGRVDLTKMEEGGLDAAFFAVFIGQGDRTPEKYDEVHTVALNTFHSVKSSINKNSDRAVLATSANDALAIKKQGKRAIYIGVENGYPIGKDISRVKEFYDLGARYLTLCHTKNNDICDSSTDPKGPEHNGLSTFGIEVVKELNRLGMMIDVSHISDQAFYQSIEHSAVPVIASHSCARAVCDNPRNLSDEMLTKLAENGGVIQICLLSSYVKPDEPYPARDSARVAINRKYGNFQELEPEIRRKAIEEWYGLDEIFPPKLATVSDLVDHIDHIVNLIGIDYVGIGSDFDGGGALKDCADASQMINITVELLKRGYSGENIKKIWGENFLRVFQQVEAFAQSQL